MEELFTRTIGFIHKKDIKKIKKMKIAVCGLGGMGGVCAELLVRLGYENISLIEMDHFEKTNLNRQIHSNLKNIGKMKGVVLKNEFLKINPSLNIKLYLDGVTDSNLSEIVKDHDILVNGIDNTSFSNLLRIEVVKQKKPMVDAWFTPNVSVFFYDPKRDGSITDFMGYELTGIDTSLKFTNSLKKKCRMKDIKYVESVLDSSDIIDKKIVKDVVNGKYQKQFPIMVWMSGCLMANEIFKYTIDRGELAPLSGCFINYLRLDFYK